MPWLAGLLARRAAPLVVAVGAVLLVLALGLGGYIGWQLIAAEKARTTAVEEKALAVESLAAASRDLAIERSNLVQLRAALKAQGDAISKLEADAQARQLAADEAARKALARRKAASVQAAQFNTWLQGRMR